VTITGANLTGATGVKFGSANASSFAVNSDSSIEAAAPPGAGTVDVTVTRPGGTSAISPADQFTYVAAGPPPTVTKLSPTKGPSTGGTLVTITGTNLTGAENVKFGANPAVIKTVAATSITVEDSAGTGTVYVIVTTPNGGSPTSGKGAMHAKFKYKKVKK
jgi:hypothetical protein